MTPEEVWRAKSDVELVAASERIQDYTAVGQQVILAELHRRRELGLIGETIPADGAAVLAEIDDDEHTRQHAPTGVLSAFWYGHVPLRKTYWVFGVLMNFLWAVVISLAEAAGVLPLALVLVLASLVYAVFIMVAIWRSAGRYTGKRIWADLARLSIVLGLVRVVAAPFMR